MSTFGQFIAENVEAIVDDFEAFARGASPAAAKLDSKELRDHAKVVMQAVAADMDTAQTSREQHLKATGDAVEDPFSRVKETSRMHARHRFEQGFTLPEMLSEYRALRASVIARWTSQLTEPNRQDLLELTRFGEAVDEGLTEAIGWYSKMLEDSRNLLMGVLAHDLRSPLSAVRTSAEYLLRSDRLVDSDLRAATRIASSSMRMSDYVSDLLDFARTLLGATLPIARAPVDLTKLSHDVVDEIRAAHPTATVELEAPDTLQGHWDAARLSQMLSNLVTNAIIHGAPKRPVTVQVAQTDGASVIAVHNDGEPIPAEDVPALFQPLQQSSSARLRRPGSSGMGLGLYIAREIAVAHGGTISVTSDADTGTTFTVWLPPGLSPPGA
jgi:signal transduction histidine kinase